MDLSENQVIIAKNKTEKKNHISLESDDSILSNEPLDSDLKYKLKNQLKKILSILKKI